MPLLTCVQGASAAVCPDSFDTRHRERACITVMNVLQRNAVLVDAFLANDNPFAADLCARVSQPHPSIPHWDLYRYDALPSALAPLGLRWNAC
jgi:hypothetical protein